MSESPQQSRAKRQKTDRNGRFAALERLKNLKGNKNKYEVGEVDNVYDEVSEKEYAKRVLSRAGEDWIEDDGTGYVEHGREIFDEESGDEDESQARKNDKSKKSEKKSKKRLRDINKPVEGNGSIRSLFGNVQPVKKEKVKLEDDDILADILGDIETNSSKSNGASTSANASTTAQGIHKLDEVALVKEYMANFSKSVQRKPEVKKESTSDDEMLERILKPLSKDNTAVRRSMKRSREETIVPPAEKKPHIEKSEPQVIARAKAPKKVETPVETPTKVAEKIDIKKEVQTPKIAPDMNLEVSELNNDDDMDFSMLDDDENQFGNEVSESTESKAETAAKAEEIKTEMIRKEKENYANLLTSWENTAMNDDEDDALLGSFDVENAQASIANTVTDKTILKFWYWDAYEDPNKCPGKVFLFGRMPMDNNPREFKSVCVTVENVERCLYLLPRKYALDPITLEETDKEVTMSDVYQEFNDYCPHTFKSKKTDKHFAFNVPGVKVPQNSEYLQVLYDGKYPAPDSKKIFLNIAHVFGCHTNALETFLLRRKIKGPCWLTVTNYEVAKVQQSTWCNLAITCRNVSQIKILK